MFAFHNDLCNIVIGCSWWRGTFPANMVLGDVTMETIYLWVGGILFTALFGLIAFIFSVSSYKLSELQKKIDSVNVDLHRKTDELTNKIYSEIAELEKRRLSMASDIYTSLSKIEKLLYEIKVEIAERYVSKEECERVHSRSVI